MLAFEPLKASILRVGAIVLAVIWLFGARRVRLSPITVAGSALLGAAFVSTLVSVEPAISLFGSFDRGTGWLTLAACAVLMLIAADICADPAARERLLAALALGAAVPCAYAIAQRVGFDPVVWTTRGTPGSTLASPTFLGGFLVLVAPIAVYKTVQSALRGPSARYAGWLLLTLVTGTVTLLTTIRGPILGLAVGLATFAVVSRLPPRVVAFGAAVALVLAVVVAGSAGVLGFQRFANIARLGDSSVERLTVWRDALGLPFADPLRLAVGFGPDSQQVSIERAEATMRLTQNQQWDRAHNVVLDAWLTGGGLGVAALIGFGAAIGAEACRGRERRDRWLVAAVLGALVGHAVEVFFAFETVTSSAVLWLLAGVVASLAPPAPVESRRMPLAFVGLLLVPLAATPALADTLYGAARRSDYAAGAALEETAAALAPWVEELPRAAGLDWLQIGERQRAEADLRQAAARAHEEPLPWLRLVRFYLQADALDTAEASCQQALRTGPFRSAVWDVCADVASRAGDAELASTRRARAEALRH